MKIRFLLVLFCSVTLFGAFYAATRAHESSQPFNHRSVGRLPTERNEPLRIRAVKVKGRSVRSKERFLSDDDWLNGLTITVKNRSEKEILYASIQLQFPRTFGLADPIAVDDIDYGNRALLTRSPTPAERSAAISAGQEVDIRLNFVEHDLIRKLLSQTGYPVGINEVHLRVGKIIFEDDTMWYAGSRLQRDPTAPSNWVNTELSASAKRGTAIPMLSVKSAFPAVSDKFLTGRAVEGERSLFQRNTTSAMEGLFLKASYSAMLPEGCRAFLRTSVAECYNASGNCHRSYDMLSDAAGDYFLANASGLCKTDSQASCQVYGSVLIANSCSTDGGGGGGGGEAGSECWSDWDCDFGYSCDQSTGGCQDDSGYGGLMPE